MEKIMNRDMAEHIAKDFISDMNPTNWNGEGEHPVLFDTRIMTYDIGSQNGNELDISFEYEEDPNTGEKSWTHCCELKDVQTGDTIEIIHGYGVDSYLNLADTILDICREE